MQRQIVLSVGIALANAVKVAGQAAATTTSNPLNNFIGAAGAAASQIKSADAAETASSSSSSSSTSPSTTSTPPPPAATTSHSAAAAHSGLSEGAKIGIIVGCVVGALLILAILAGIFCCLVRRRRRNKRRTVDANEKETSPKPWKSPINPGRHYSNYTPAQRGEVTGDNHHPTVPLMAAAATDHHMRDSEKAPSLSQHPAMRPQPENPFVPVPPSPRRTEPNQHGSGVRDGLIAGTAAGAGAYAMHEHNSQQSKGRKAVPTYNNNYPNYNDSGARDGLMAGTATGAGAYGMHEHHNRNSKASTALPAYNNNNNNNRHDHHDSGVSDGLIAAAAAGTGAYAMHEHNNNRHSNSPSALPTHNNNNPDRPPTPFGLAGFGNTTTTAEHQPRASSPPYASVGQPYNDMHVHVLQTDPPSRDLRHSLQKHEENVIPYTTYADDQHPTYRNSKGYSTPPEVPSRSPNRRPVFADSSYDSSLSTTTSSNDSGYARYSDPYAPRQRESIQPYLQQHQPQQAFMTGANNETPPVPVEYRQQGGRRTSHSPRGSRSPAVSINGQPRRLRFEDLHPNEVGGQGHDSWDGYGYGGGEGQRWSQGVGEAL